MQPALEDGDWVIAQRRRGAPARGDVVVFALGDDADTFLIKRIVGLPGERLEISDGQVHIDGQTLAEPWANGPTFPDGSEHIPDDAVWVLGDNRALSSADSRTAGAISVADIGWRVFAVYWPSSRMGMI
jgi:signal peptidase I